MDEDWEQKLARITATVAERDVRFLAGKPWKPRKPHAPKFFDMYKDHEPETCEIAGLYEDLLSEKGRWTCPIYAFVDGERFDFVTDIVIKDSPYGSWGETRADDVVRMQAELIASALTQAARDPAWCKANLRYLCARFRQGESTPTTVSEVVQKIKSRVVGGASG